MQADRDAQRVPRAASATRSVLRRACGCAGAASCASCASEAHRAPMDATDERAGSSVPPVVHDALRTPGRPLDTAELREHGRRVGHDLRDVRIHDDPTAAAAAVAVGARAFTVGQHIVFAAGAFTPGTPEGRSLLAHELVHATAHAAPQASQRAVAPGDIRIGAADSSDEHAAERAETAGRPALPLAGSAHHAAVSAPTPAPAQAPDATADVDEALAPAAGTAAATEATAGEPDRATPDAATTNDEPPAGDAPGADADRMPVEARP